MRETGTDRFVIVLNLPDDSDAGSVADWFHGIVHRAYPDCDPNPTAWREIDFAADVAQYGLDLVLSDRLPVETSTDAERRIDQDPDTGEWVGSEWKPSTTREGYVEQTMRYGQWPRFATKAEAEAWRDRTPMMKTDRSNNAG